MKNTSKIDMQNLLTTSNEFKASINKHLASSTDEFYSYFIFEQKEAGAIARKIGRSLFKNGLEASLPPALLVFSCTL